MDLKNEPMLVKNSVGTTGNPPKGYNSWLQWYFNGNIPSSMKCPSCGCLMIRPNKFTNHKRLNSKSLPLMVGGHVEFSILPHFHFITPICNECNDKKENLKPFYVKLGDLKHPPF